MRLLIKTAGFALAAAAVLLASILAYGHVMIRRIDPPLPALADVLRVDREAALPVRMSFINTASQKMARSAVLDPELDPDPRADYTMSHPSFVIEWQDGRILLLDLGMGPADAIAFGRNLQRLADAQPIEPHASVSQRLGEARARVAGIAFTHLHADHTSGLDELCADLGMRPDAERIPILQGRFQLLHVNHTTRGPKRQIEAASCTRQQPLVSNAAIAPLPGFPGVSVILAGGHTPGSQIFVVHLRVPPGRSEGRYDDVRTWVVAGDIVNHAQGIALDLPKPRLYSLLVVPESGARLAKLRHFLARLGEEPGVTLLVSHDQQQLEASGLASY